MTEVPSISKGARWLLCIFLFAYASHAAAAQRADIYYFVETSARSEQRSLRYIISDAFLRIDNDGKDQDFVLYDRRAGRIASVAHENKTIVIFPQHPVEVPLEAYGHGIRIARVGSQEAVADIGKFPGVGYGVFVGSEVCLNTISLDISRDVDRIHDPFIDAFGGFMRTLSWHRRSRFHDTPESLRDPCDTALFITEPDIFLSVGMPILWQLPDGRSQRLLEYLLDEEVDDSLFQLPASFRRYELR